MVFIGYIRKEATLSLGPDGLIPKFMLTLGITIIVYNSLIYINDLL